MILVLDNYDSFTYNLVQYLGLLGADVRVARNDEIRVEEIEELAPERIVLSPGPGRPEDAGIMIDLIRHFGAAVPVLGVCLGHQGIAYAYGGRVEPAVRLMHGKEDRIFHNGQGIFEGLPQGFPAGRYHSLAVAVGEAPDLEIAATSADGTVMAVRHRQFPVFGIQFHPESILTPAGLDILQNFLRIPSPLAQPTTFQGDHGNG